MSKLSLEEIEKIRNIKMREIETRIFKKNRIQIFVHLDKKEILSGNKDVLFAFKKELEKLNIEGVILKQIAEEKKHNIKPFVEIIVPGKKIFQFPEVSVEHAEQILSECIPKINDEKND